MSQRTHWLAPIHREISAVWTKYIKNSAETWNGIYRNDYEEKLESASQRGRHYVVSGIIEDLFPARKVDLLDVGCGTGSMYRFVSPHLRTYLGIDIAEVAIEMARTRHAHDDRCAFAASALLTFESERLFDAVVLNEFLYYAPFDQMTAHIEKALRLLREDGVLIVSMSDNPKAIAIWRWLARRGRPTRDIRLRTPGPGNRWTVRAYSHRRA